MTGDALVAMQQLHGVGRDAHIQLLLHQLIGDRVVMPQHLDVIVEV